ncbi:hypothetical protein AHAS_Ahas17G0140300 [Arachis hypogaea]
MLAFYQRLYLKDEKDRNHLNTMTTFPKLEDDQKRAMLQIPIMEDVKTSLFNIGLLKTSGEDGYPALFFKNNWETLGKSLVRFITKFWRQPAAIEGVNQTLLALIPKSQQSEFISRLRPIAFCNVTYKCLTKILVERLKPLLKDRISSCQASFIPRRII